MPIWKPMYKESLKVGASQWCNFLGSKLKAPLEIDIPEETQAGAAEAGDRAGSPFCMVAAVRALQNMFQILVGLGLLLSVAVGFVLLELVALVDNPSCFLNPVMLQTAYALF